MKQFIFLKLTSKLQAFEVRARSNQHVFISLHCIHVQKRSGLFEGQLLSEQYKSFQKALIGWKKATSIFGHVNRLYMSKLRHCQVAWSNSLGYLVGYRYTWSKNDVISSVRKHNCAFGSGLELRLVLG